MRALSTLRPPALSQRALLRSVLWYAAASAAWIPGSDWLLARLVTDPAAQGATFRFTLWDPRAEPAPLTSPPSPTASRAEPPRRRARSQAVTSFAAILGDNAQG